ncbi:MAG: beta-ketoacyl-[acyl-carrier-protein] synthase family protein [Gammaproteobacteria bacterium]
MTEQENRRVAVTGIGMVTPLGHNVATTWQALLARKSGIAEIASFDASGFPARIAAEVKNFKPDLSLADRKLLKYAGAFCRFSLVAAAEAMADAGIQPTRADATRWGAVVGSGMIVADFDYWLRFSQRFVNTGTVSVHEFATEGKDFFRVNDIAKATANSGLNLLLKKYQIKGYAMDVHTACASSGQALGLALQVLRRGEVDTVLAGGYDSMVNPIGLSSFCLLDALATDNEDPARASRPFDLSRNGFVLGEGAAFLVLESWHKAKARGARIYAELAGEGNSLSAYRITDSHPSGDGAIQAIKGALADANIDASDVDYINAHGTSTQMNDLSETNAIKAVLGEHAKKIPISSTKSQTGHLIAAAGALEATFSCLAIHHGRVPMTANLTQPDPQCDLDYVVEGPRQQSVGTVLSNSFGFGGSNSCIAFRHPRITEELL